MVNLMSQETASTSMNSYSVLDVLAAVIKHLDELTWLLPVDADSFNSSSLSNQPSEKPPFIVSETRTHFPGGETWLLLRGHHQHACNLVGSRRPEWDARDPTPRLETGGSAGLTRVGGLGGWRRPPTAASSPSPGGRARAGLERGGGVRAAASRVGGFRGRGARRALPPRSPRGRSCPAPPRLPDPRGARQWRPRGPGRARGRAALASPRPDHGPAWPPSAALTGLPRGAAEAEDPGSRIPWTPAARGNRQRPGGPRPDTLPLRLGTRTPEAARKLHCALAALWC
ncbi:elongin BC and Polycomb repressive complex 2-associated protein-like [Bubalus bubalis]|uniref:elongin BC and Polycomb repressive complex 2-associated protein-like n=1 Tax=Bubalus bubalis TaxID=89462 RepID=UPI001E1B701B|nr:elongin BC and Polycomb repressive complex 2-associated protein-like [Bubalus bubalis]